MDEKAFFTLLTIGLIIYAIWKSNKMDYERKVEEIRKRDISYAQYGNRDLLKKFGEEKFILYFGEESLKLVKEGRDTKIFEMRSDVKERLGLVDKY